MQITVRREPVELLGKNLIINKEAPAAKVYSIADEEIVVGMIATKPQIFIALPSLKSEVCSYGAKKFNEILEGYDILSYIVTTDDILQCKLFTETNCINNAAIVSDKNLDFGNKFGILIKDGYLKDKLARSVFVVDIEGIVKYINIVSEITDEADYDAAILAVSLVCKPHKKSSHNHENWMKV